MTRYLGRLAGAFIGGFLMLGLLVATALAADGDPAVDPETARAILASFFTLSGATVAAGIVAGVIQILKGFGRFGAWLEEGNEYIAAMAASVFLILFAIVALSMPLDLVSDFGYFLAWLGLAKLIQGMYDVAVKPIVNATKTSA